MAFLEKLFTSFHNYADGNTRIGELNRIWYDSNSNTFRIQLDKVTPGGTIIGGGSGGGLTTATVSTMIANSLTNYATQTYVTTRGYITTASLSVTTLVSGTNALTYNNGVFTFTPSNLSSYATQDWVNNHNYLTAGEGMTALNATPNQTVVQDLGSGVWRVGTVQNLNTTATVQFGDLTVNNISILGTGTNLVSDVVQGYRLYLASSATNLSQINGGGIQLGNTATGVHSIFWNAGGYWDTDGDGIKTLNLEATTSTLATLKVLNQARFGYVNRDITLANAYIQVDSDSNNFSQIAIINHNTGTNASADIVATNDTGNDSTGFIDMGINSSVFSTSSWTVNGANDGYLYVAGGGLAIGTDQVGGEIKTFLGPLDNPKVISVVNASTITYSVDLMPSVDAQYQLGKPGLRWKGIYVGTGSLWIQDIGLGTDAELTVNNGVLYVNGAYQLQVGQLKFFNNTIESTTGATDIQIGLSTSTANLVLNRNTVLAAGKTFGLIDTVLGTTATMAVSNGVLTVNGANQLQVGQLKFIDNTIESTTGAIDIQIGLTTSTANLVLNRNTVLAAGKSLVFGSGGQQSVAWNSTATVQWSQITGTPAIGVTSITTGTGIRVDHSTGTVNISFANDGGYITSAALATYATQTYVNSQGFITSSALSPYTPTSGLGTIIANSLTNYATQTYVNSQGFITSSALSPYTPTSGLGTIIANSLTNYATQTYVTTRGYITTASLSVTTAASGTSALSYLNGVFTFTPPNLSAYLTTVTNVAYANTATNLVGGIGVASLAGSSGTSVSTSTGAVTVWFNTGTLVANAVNAQVATTSTNAAYAYSFNTGTLVANAVNAQVATTATNAGYAYSFNTGTLVANAVNAQVATTATNAAYAYSFNTGTLVTTAVTANSVAGGYVSSITAGTGTAVSTSTGAVTVWAVPQAITSTGTTQASNYTLDLSGASFVHWQPTANGSRTITLTGFTPGRKTEVFITPHTTNDIFTVTGVTGSQCSNGVNTFTMQGVGASAQSSFMLQIYCTTNAIGGVWIYGNGSL